MGRGRVQLKRIENKISRQVTFSKRRKGLVKKAHEISVLCGAEVALIVFSSKGKLFEFSSETSIERILEKYERRAHTEQLAGATNEFQGNWSLDYFKLTAKVEVIERNLRNFAGHDLDTLSLKELQSLEQQLVIALKRIRTRKNQVMNECLSELQKKAKALQLQSNMLAKKTKEKGKTLTETQDKNSFTISLSLVPSLTLSGTFQARASPEEMTEAQTTPSSNTLIPPWMLLHSPR